MKFYYKKQLYILGYSIASILIIVGIILIFNNSQKRLDYLTNSLSLINGLIILFVTIMTSLKPPIEINNEELISSFGILGSKKYKLVEIHIKETPGEITIINQSGVGDWVIKQIFFSKTDFNKIKHLLESK